VTRIGKPLYVEESDPKPIIIEKPKKVEKPAKAPAPVAPMKEPVTVPA